MDIEDFFVRVGRIRFDRTFRRRQFFFTEASLTPYRKTIIRKTLRKPAILSGEEVVVPKRLHGGKLENAAQRKVLRITQKEKHEKSSDFLQCH